LCWYIAALVHRGAQLDRVLVGAEVLDVLHAGRLQGLRDRVEAQRGDVERRRVVEVVTHPLLGGLEALGVRQDRAGIEIDESGVLVLEGSGR
jgi:hypothetical protein